MSTKKRSRQEFEEEDRIEEGWQVETVDVSKYGLTQGLCQLWGVDSKQVRQGLSRELSQLEGVNHRTGKVSLNRRQKKTIPLVEYKYKHMNTLWDVIATEAQQDLEQDRPPITFELPEIHCQGSRHVSTLQKRLLEKGGATATLNPQMKKYLNALTVFEYEHDHGTLSGEQQDMQLTMIGESCWTPLEKNKFFIALERCGYNLEEIARRVGPTKTVAEIQEYLNLLHQASMGIGKDPTIKPLAAREMSPFYILQENYLATQLQHTLETEVYAKHLEFVQDTTKTEIQASNQLLELWNMSSLTRL